MWRSQERKKKKTKSVERRLRADEKLSVVSLVVSGLKIQCGVFRGEVLRTAQCLSRRLGVKQCSGMLGSLIHLCYHPAVCLWPAPPPLRALGSSCLNVGLVRSIEDFQSKTQALYQRERLDFKSVGRTSLVARWLRIRLPMQGTRVWALVREDPTRRGAPKPMRHNYWARMPHYWSLRA